MKKILDSVFCRFRHVCPWWICRGFDNALRRLIHDPQKILAPHVRPGAAVLDVGPGMGYFTIPLARMVGENGQVTAADIQEKMLKALERRARHAGLEKRIRIHLCRSDSLLLKGKFDFILAFWMVHEVPDRTSFFNQLRAAIRPGGRLLLVEPKLHVAPEAFRQTCALALRSGFTADSEPSISFSRSLLLAPSGGGTNED